MCSFVKDDKPFYNTDGIILSALGNVLLVLLKKLRTNGDSYSYLVYTISSCLGEVGLWLHSTKLSKFVTLKVLILTSVMFRILIKLKVKDGEENESFFIRV